MAHYLTNFEEIGRKQTHKNIFQGVLPFLNLVFGLHFWIIFLIVAEFRRGVNLWLINTDNADEMDYRVPRVLIQDLPYYPAPKGPFVHAMDNYFDGWREVPMKMVKGVTEFFLIFVNIFGGFMCLTMFLAIMGDERAVHGWLVEGMQLPAEMVEGYLPWHKSLQESLQVSIGPKYVPVYQGVVRRFYSDMDFNFVKMWTSYWNWVQGVLGLYP